MSNNPLQSVKHIIAVSSCKGGVGKSTISALLSYQLAQKGMKVGLIDADIHGPSIPLLFNLNNVQVKADANNQLIPLEQNGVKIMSFGFLLGDGPAVLRGPIVSRYVQEIILRTAWGELDYLIIDMPPGTGDIQLTITQQVKLDGALIVTTPQSLSLIDVARGILMFEKVNVPILGIIENMAYFTCHQCSEKHHIFGEHSESYFKERLGVDILAQLPLVENFTKENQIFENNPSVEELTSAFLESIEDKKEGEAIPRIKFDENHITLTFEDGRKCVVAHKDVRLNCPCALCVNELTHERMINEHDIKDDIAPKTITPIGHYAIGIAWNDGHETGIYPYSLFEKLNTEEKVT